MRVKLEWTTYVTETYATEIELDAEDAAKVQAGQARGLPLWEALVSLHEDGDGDGWHSMLAGEETDDAQTHASVTERELEYAQEVTA